MKTLYKTLCKSLFVFFTLGAGQTSYAHMMVAQHGTLNVIDDGVFMVLSLPVSAFSGVDDDQDGKLSKAEFTLHRPAIAKLVNENVTLKDSNGKLTLQGMMLSLVTSHHSPNQPASQLVVMGRYGLTEPASLLHYQVGLFGNKADEQSLEITATRKTDNKKQRFKLSPKNKQMMFFE
ncbi:hypothetical protein [Paraglaciecola sp. L3A3]|uniref:hypothetical protein n=1 Tax=Paraglaciecola sp. L3A3 TaxID=2686358 RepID=UPI00131C539B|nr:hypothetical protein [Paraglaciecola sp. L3A3]